MFTATQCGLQLIRKRFVFLAIPLLLPLALILLAGYAHAAVINELSAFETTTEFTVNSTNDTAVCGETTCTLRGAIVAANSQAGADTVVFSLPADSAISLSAALPVITDSLAIDGSVVPGLTINGATAYRIFEIGGNAAVSLNHLSLSQGGSNMLGGAILVDEDGQLTVSNCRFVLNAAANRGGAIHNDGGKVIVSESEFSENSAVNRGGAIYNDGGQLTISTSTFSTNTTTTSGEGGGAIYNSGGLILTASNFDHNAVNSTTGGGGALFNAPSSLATVANSTFSTNSAVDGGGAIRNAGTLTMTGSTVAHNLASDTSSAGGGLLNSSSGVALIANSTFHGNGAFMGGGIRNSALLTLINVTLSENSADPGYGGGLFNTGKGTLNYTNSILANSLSGSDCRNEGTIAIRVENLVESGVCGQDIMADPVLGPLQDNGGPTWTQALLAGSPAVNVGDNGACAADPVSNVDQRGMDRPQAIACDLGAYEVEAIAGLAADSDSPTNLGSSTTFTATVTAGESVAYEWTFGDGSTGTGAVVSHTYLSAGNYTAVVTATNAASQLTATTEVVVGDAISGLTAANDSPTPLGELTHLTATITSGAGVSYLWDFGDGHDGGGASPSHTYAAVGSYTAVVTATNALGSATASTDVLVEESIAGLTAGNDGPTALGDLTQLSATVTAGSNVVYEWDFGDGQTGSGASPSHTYAAVGSYTAVVTATNALGSATASTDVLVEESIAGLTAGNDGPTALGDLTQLSATVTAGSNVVYEWDFGDGQDGGGASPSHTYAAVGSYTAVVTATNALGSATASTDVLVEEVIAGLTAGNDGPTALGDLTQLSATVTAGSNVVYEWDFGDGQDGGGASPSHTYAAVGSYTAVVTATNALGSATASTDVLVEEVIAGLTAGNDGPTALGDLTQLSATVTAGSNVVYEWDFGDGQDGSGASPSHTYAAVGSYTAVVTATNALGSATASTDVLVEEVIAGLAVEHDTLTVLGEPVIFTAMVTAGSNVVYEWDFGDGHTSSGATTNHTYLESGQFTIVVTATNTISQQMLTTKITVAKVLYRSYMPVIAKP